MGGKVFKDRLRSGHRKNVFRPIICGIDEQKYCPDGRTILIVRQFGGSGDILMTRPIFAEIKRRQPSIVIHYSIPRMFVPLVVDHPDIDFIIPFERNDDNISDYGFVGDISKACIQHEAAFQGNVHVQRMDLWAEELGIDLSDHGANFNFTQQEIDVAKRILARRNIEPEKFFLIAPYSAASNRNLLRKHVDIGVKWAKDKGLLPIVLHHCFLDEFHDLVQITDTTMREWLALSTFARMVFTTDTAALHVVGFLKKPTVAFFNYTSGRVVSKHYPTVVSVQLHRAEDSGMSCCPCYNWSTCPYLDQHHLPLKCFADIPDEMVLSALETCWSQPFVEDAQYDIVAQIDWSKTLEPHPINIDGKKELGSRNIRKVYILYTGNRKEMTVVISSLAEAVKMQNRNVKIEAIVHEDLHVFFKDNLFIDYVGIEIKDIEEQVEILDMNTCLASEISIVDYCSQSFGINIRNTKAQINFKQEIIDKIDSKYQQQCLVNTLSFPLHIDGIDEIMLSQSIPSEEKMLLIRKSKVLVTDDVFLAVVGCFFGITTIVLSNKPSFFKGYRTHFCLSPNIDTKALKDFICWKLSND